MRSALRLIARLAIAGVAAGVCLIGWMSQTSSAQPQDPPPLQIDRGKDAPQDLPVPTVAEVANPPGQVAADSAQPTPSSEAATPMMRDEDPEKTALTFAEDNQKQAESQLRVLREEEAKLKSRLIKLEAGIKRWESVLVALKQSQAARGEIPSPKTPRFEPRSQAASGHEKALPQIESLLVPAANR
jgi:hypothetical protein